jgi:hypothetical protein
LSWRRHVTCTNRPLIFVFHCNCGPTGQKLYYTSHSFFLSERSLYFVVFNLASPQQSNVEFWYAHHAHNSFLAHRLNVVHDWLVIHNQATIHPLRRERFAHHRGRYPRRRPAVYRALSQGTDHYYGIP